MQQVEWRQNARRETQQDLFLDGVYCGYVVPAILSSDKGKWYGSDERGWYIVENAKSEKEAKARMVEYSNSDYSIERRALYARIARCEVLPTNPDELCAWPESTPLYVVRSWQQRDQYFFTWQEARQCIRFGSTYLKSRRESKFNFELVRRHKGRWRTIAQITYDNSRQIEDYIYDLNVPKEFRPAGLRATPIYRLLQLDQELSRSTNHCMLTDVQAQWGGEPNNLTDAQKRDVDCQIAICRYLTGLMDDLEKGSPQGCQPFYAMTTKQLGEWFGITPDMIQERVQQIEENRLWELTSMFLLTQWHPDYNHRRWISCWGGHTSYFLHDKIFKNVLYKIALRTKINELQAAGAEMVAPKTINVIVAMKECEAMINDMDDEVL